MHMKTFALAGLTLALGFGASAAMAASVTGTLTADNHYGLYVGNADGSELTFIGRNEVGSAGSPGAYNWSLAETWNFDIDAGDYLYVMAWDAGAGQGWIGNFTSAAGDLGSGVNGWVSAVAPGGNPGSNGQLPDVGVLGGYIAGANWQAPAVSKDNGGAPWGTIAGVGDADWIWHDTFASNSSSDTHFAMFRSANPLVTAVPEAQTWALLLAGLGLIGLRTSRQHG